MPAIVFDVIVLAPDVLDEQIAGAGAEHEYRTDDQLVDAQIREHDQKRNAERCA